MKRYLANVILSLLVGLIMGSCSNDISSGECNGVYYWRTTFSINDYEKEFLNNHNIKRLFVRFFDVDDDKKINDVSKVIPRATLQFKDSIVPGIEIVPTIYITTSAIESMQTKEAEYAEKILRRINAMCLQNGILFKELQLDCDWTKHTQQHFFKLCEEIKSRLDSTQSLSSTIRLHQLTQTPPPVDKGVLMVYNTGNLMEMKTENSIFSRKDIEPYLRDNRLALYPLPLDVAYPAYGWALLFRKGQEKYYFDRILRQTNLSSYPQIKQIGKNVYEVTSDINFSPETKSWPDVYRGHRIRIERPSAEEILEVKYLIERQLVGKPHNNIIYHLDQSQLTHYSENEINKIYSSF